MDTPKAEEIKQAVREHYSALARQAASCCGGEGTSSQVGSCCGGEGTSSLAAALYQTEKIQGLPESVTAASAGCGNPLAFGEMQPGETVLDLGSGGGIDCFLAGQEVGSGGKVIGLDMTPAMVALARENKEKLGADNVEFRLGEIEHMPVESQSVDVIISNCVINLSPDKDAVFEDAYRVLRPGGRLCVSDIVLLAELPPEVFASLERWAACVAGALQRDSYLDKIRRAGFTQVEVPEETEISIAALGVKIASIKVKAVKS